MKAKTKTVIATVIITLITMLLVIEVIARLLNIDYG